MKKLLPIFIAVIIIALAGAFYGGMKYGQGKSLTAIPGAARGLTNLTPEERQARLQQFGNADMGGQRGAQPNGGFLSGEIISKDDKSITIKLRDGGSKIIFFSASTEITKFATGTLEDLKAGDSLTVNGQANQDGSITAQSIQIRTEMPNQN